MGFEVTKKKREFKIDKEHSTKRLEQFAQLYESTCNPDYYSSPKISDDKITPFCEDYSN